jgi:dihydrofolate synthase / folylpolyglutamate synthase
MKTLDFLYGLQTRGMKFGLANITRLLASAGNPHTRFPSVHIAGTNGKGSTAALIASVLMEHGMKTGLYTSPHLVRFTERIRINGEEMPLRRLVSYTRTLRPAIEEVGATFFEATTAICFLYFADEQIDIGVIETGMGGRLDSTNVITPLVSVITNVTFEHREYLGNSVRAIAREKAGIIKPHVPCVTATRDPVVLSVLRAAAAARRSRLGTIRPVSVRELRNGTLECSTKRLGTFFTRPGLHGSFQRANIRLAIAALAELSRKALPGGRKLNLQKIARGFARVVENSGIRGRFERVHRDVLLDVAHNPAGMQALALTLREKKFRISSAVFGVMKDKESRPMVATLKGLTTRIVAVAPGTGRAKSVEEIRKESPHVTTSSGVGAGLSSALRHNRRGEVVLVTGSHYVVGEALEWLGRKKLDNPR